MNSASRPKTASARTARPTYLAHFVIRTTRLKESVEWYANFLDAEVVYGNDYLVFLTFDDEHHRVAICAPPGLEPHSEKGAGVDHIAFAFATMEDLVAHFERLKPLGIRPHWCINHGPTTSMYYKDPDGVQLEAHVDNLLSEHGGPRGFMRSPLFDENPIGVEFDPDVLVEQFHAGVPVEELMKRGSASRRPGRDET